MAAFTQLEDRDVRALAAKFHLGAVRDWAPIAAGTVNSNFRIDTAGGRFFLRINEGKTEADVRYEADVVDALAAAGVPTPRPLRAGGRPYARHGNQFASAFAWVEGVHRCQAGVTPEDAYRVGAALGRLHRAGAPLAARFDRPGIYTYAHICDRVAAIRAVGAPELADAEAMLADEIAWLDDRADVRAAAPRGVIHGDLFRDNVLWDGRDLAALLDFEQACTGSLTYDLAVAINAWCYGDTFSPALVAAVVAGYHRERPLTAADRDALYVECRAAAMRFAVTRITDIHLRDTTATKDFRRYLERLARWRSLGRSGLARQAGLDLL